MPTYEDGNAITYQVVERNAAAQEAAGYTTLVEHGADGWTVTNKHMPLTKSITATKVWDDSDDAAGQRPAYITFTLTGERADGTAVPVSPATQRVYGAAVEEDLTVTWNGLPVYAGGEPIDYEVAEADIAGYTTSVQAPASDDVEADEAWTITNTYIGTDVELAFTKNVVGNSLDSHLAFSLALVSGDADAVIGAPQDKQVSDHLAGGSTTQYAFAPVRFLTAGTYKFAISETSTASDGWTYDNEAHEVTVTVAPGADGKLVATVKGNNPTIVNTFESIADVTVTKQWVDGSNEQKLRPTNAEFADMVHLLADNKPVDDAEAAVVDNGDDTYTVTFAGLPTTTAEGSVIEYTVSEDQIEGYEADTATVAAGGTLVNSLSDSHDAEVSGVKVWDDKGNDIDHDNAAEIDLVLTRTSANGSEVVEATPTWNDDTFTYTGLDELDAQGARWTYTVSEAPIPGYTTETQGNSETGYTFKNTLVTIDVDVAKNWVDDGDQDGIRPDDIEVQLLADGQAYRDALTLNADGNWAGTWENLPKYANGERILYTVDELDEVEGYNTYITGDMANGFVISNVHGVEVGDLLVMKKWDDGDDQDGLRKPVAVTLNKKVGEAEAEPVSDYKSIQLDADNNWTFAIHALPVYEGGQKITYSFVEDAVPEGYTVAYEPASLQLENDTIANVTVTNTHEVGTTSVTATKVWVDENNADGMRADAHLRLIGTAGDERIDFGEKVIAANATGDGLTATWSDLPTHHLGASLTFEVVEQAIPGYTTAVSQPAQGADGTWTVTVTNTHTASTPSTVMATKVWDDNNDQDGVRADAALFLNRTVNGITEKVNGSDKTIAKDATGDALTVTWENLPTVENGKPVAYTVAETEMPDYQTTITCAEEGVFTVTNKHVPETAAVEATKVWGRRRPGHASCLRHVHAQGQ